MKIIKPLTFNPFTFSRASEASYYASTGLLAYASIDVLREDAYDPETLERIGIILEDEATNYLLHSTEFEESSWTLGSGTVTDNFYESPDGTTNAAVLSGTISQSVSGLPSGPYTISLYVNSAIAGGLSTKSIRMRGFTNDTSVVYEFYANGTVGVVPAPGSITTGSVQKLQDGWWRLSYHTNFSATSINVNIAALSGASFGIAMAQLERGNVATSYIESGSSAGIRYADVVLSQTPSLVSSNIDEDDADVWDAGTSYIAGNEVIVLGSYHRIYESIGSNTNKYPPENPSDWLDKGATNRWRMFDMQAGAEKQSISTASSGDIDVVVQVDVPVNAITLLNASGSTARITMRNGAADTVYDREFDLLGTSMGIGWWEFFFGYRSGVKTIVVTDMPKIAPATIQVEIDGGDGLSGLGKLIIGEDVEIGCARFGTTVGIIDFSRKERDAFGNNYILERRYIDKVDYDIQIDSDKVDDVKQILSDIRATPAVYIGSENKFKSTVVYGFYRDFSIVIAGSKKSSCAIQVEGI